MNIITCALLHLKRMSKYRSVIFGCFMAPVIVICIIAFFTHGASNSDDAISVSLVNNDKGTLASSMISELKNNKTISYKECSLENAKSNVKINKADIALVIPSDFSEKIQNASAPDVKIFKLSATNTDVAVTNGIYSFITKEMIVSDVSKSSGEKNLANEIKKQIADKIITTDISMANSTVNTSVMKSVILNLFISFLMYSMIYIVNELLSLKKSRTLRRCISTPHKNISIATSLVLAFLCIGWIQAALMMGVPHILFNMSLGHSFIALFLTITVLFIVILSMGMLVCSFIKNEELAPVIVNMVITITCMIGGSFMPLEYMPDFMKKLAVFTPQNWALTALQDVILKGKGLIYILPKLGVLLLFAAAFLTAAAASMRKFVEEA